MPGQRHRRPTPGRQTSARNTRVVILAVGTTVALWLTVGLVTGIIAGILVVLDRLVLPGRHVLATSAVVALALIPILWFVGSELPLSPPALRIQDNAVAHHIGGLAVWLLFLSAVTDAPAARKEST